jgi:hypothetical protein
MKKLFALVGVLVLLAAPAFGDEPINGTITVDEITLYAGCCQDPIRPCELTVTFTTCNNQGPYVLPVSALGDQINEALLEAYLGQLAVDVGLLLTIIPDDPPTFGLAVDAVHFPGNGALCP